MGNANEQRVTGGPRLRRQMDCDARDKQESATHTQACAAVNSKMPGLQHGETALLDGEETKVAYTRVAGEMNLPLSGLPWPTGSLYGLGAAVSVCGLCSLITMGPVESLTESETVPARPFLVASMI